MSGRRVVVVVLVLALLAVPVAAHGNYVSADPQVSADGTVQIELAVVVTDAFVVLHTDDNGSIGRPVGHGSFDGYIAHDLAVELDAGYWASVSGNASLWVALHHDDGDGEFEPEDDPVLTAGSTDEPVADRLAVRRGDTGAVNVIAERDQPQETDDNVVTIRAVRLASDGYVVIRADEQGGPGRVVGAKALAAGEHTDVTVTIDETFYERRPESFNLWAVVHGSDGDGAFDADADPAVVVGEHRVMSRFAVERTDSIEHTPTPTATVTPDVHSDPSPTATPTEGHDDHDHEHTPTATEGHDDHEHTHEVEETATTAHETDDDGHDHTHAEDATATPGQPGFGVVLATLAVLAAGWLAGRRSAG